MKWEVHIEGPDDVLTFDSEVEAHRYAKAINAAAKAAQHGASARDRVLCNATVRRIDDAPPTDERRGDDA